MKKLFMGVAVILIVLGAGFWFGESYFAERFFANSYLGNVEISYLTEDEANEKIKTELANYDLAVTEAGRTWGSLTFDQLGLEVKPEEQVAALRREQSQQNWLTSFFKDSQLAFDTQAVLAIEAESMEAGLATFESFFQERQAPTDASLVYSPEAGYTIQSEQIGTQLDQTVLTDLLLETVQAPELSLDVSDAYLQPAVTAEDAELTARLAQIDAASSMSITLEIAGYEEVITPEMISGWLYVAADDGELYFDEGLIYEYLGTLNEAYATYDDYRYFESTMRGGVELVPGTLGWSIDRETEVAAILEDLYAGESVVRAPMIVGSGYNGSLDDIGASYIEVDILSQMMFVYLDGVQVISTPVVTGQIGTNTIPGAYSIWNMETPSELVGYNPRTEQDYVQPVQYWMGFDDTGQGIHDANWQPYFGGDAYLTNGSLGCINTPPDIMPLVFEYAYMGMPVVVFE